LRQSVEISRGGRNSIALPPQRFLRGSIEASKSPCSGEEKLQALHSAKFTRASRLDAYGTNTSMGSAGGSYAPESISKHGGNAARSASRTEAEGNNLLGQSLHDIMESQEYEEERGSDSKRKPVVAPTTNSKSKASWQESKLY
jgi:hypothetical protein